MAILTGSRVGVAVTAILAALGSVVYQRVTGDAAAIKALPTVWHPFTGNGRADIVFQDKLKYCEDVLFDHRQELAILSCDPGRSQWNTVMGTMYDPEPKGTLYLYNYATKSDLQPIELVGLPEGSDFHPLGINIYRHAQNPGRTRLFVVNHQRNGSTVDIFDLDYDNARATFYTSISDGDKQIISPNAIAPISYTSFYVTNDHRFIPRLNKILNTIETFTPLSLSWVTLVDFSSGAPVFSTAASNIGFANGVVLTPTGKEVIVASTTDIELLIYDRDPETNILTLREKIPLLFRPDNLTFDDGLDVNDETAFDKDGKFLRGLIVAGHPAALQLYRVSRDPDNNTAPSWIVEIRRGEEEDVAPRSATGAPRSATGAVKSAYTQRTLYQSNGEHFGTSSTGAVDFARGRMLVSGLYSKGMLEVSWEV